MYRVAVVDPRPSTRAVLCNLLRGMESVRLEEECDQYDRFVSVIFQWRPDVAIVSLDPNHPGAWELITKLAAIFPGIKIIAVIERADAALLTKVLQMRGSGYVSLPITAEKLRHALEGGRDWGVAQALPESGADKIAKKSEVVKASDTLSQDDEGEARAFDDEELDMEEALLSADPEMDASGSMECELSVANVVMPEFPYQPPLTRLFQRLRQTSKRLWRYLPFTGRVGDLVDCTVFAPPEASPGETVFIQVFAHLPEHAEFAKESAQEFDSSAIRRGFKSLEAEVRRGAKLTFHLVMPGAVIDDPVDSLVWRGPECGREGQNATASVEFDAKIRGEQSPGILIGTVSVSLDSIPLGHVKFKLTVRPHGQEPSAYGRRAVGDAAHCYRKAFISYASPDRPEVLKRVQMLARLGIDYFQDVLKLEPGERWEKQLYRHIEESDLFLLFWSTAASRSRWVLEEVRYAMRFKRGDELATPEIKPIVIEGPPPPPPPTELCHLHFNDYFLYFMNASEVQGSA